MGSNHFGKLLPHWKVTGLSHSTPVPEPVVEAKPAPAPVVKPVVAQKPAPAPVISSDDE